MPVVIQLKFPGGRYHATPWGRHVNEGVPEWPPSPWRLLRAIVAVWKRTRPDVHEAAVKRILETLAAPPEFHLPKHRVAHTRHYMPWEKKGPQDRTLIFDTFVSVGRDEPLYILWPEAELAADDVRLLGELLGNLTSLGRAEGWVEAELYTADVECNIRLADAGDPNPIPVLCADPASAFGSEHYPKHDPKKLVKGKINPSEFLFDCPPWHLCLDTETIHAARWPSVPGSKWVNYSRPVEAAAVAAKPAAPQRPKPKVARFLLDGPVLPRTIETIRVAELFRKAAMGRFRIWCEQHPKDAEDFRRTDKPEKFSSPVLSGKGLDGKMHMDHKHAYYLPTAGEDDPHHLTHIVVTAEDGFGLGEVAAFNGIRTLKFGTDDKALELRVQLVGLGLEAKFKHLPMFKPSKVWVSATPFVAQRHFKRSGTKRDKLDVVEGDFREAFLKLAAREAVERIHPGRLASVSPYEPRDGTPPAIDFRRRRERDSYAPGTRPFGYLRLEFDAPVTRPAAFGYAAHFGLGLLKSVAG